ncbi:MAG: NAD(P)H-quinone oxidoreductase [Myxococcaceae bacterium]|nr:NAD(P)H-quinone oxidoreductase [Myxococcaceae bacterium]
MRALVITDSDGPSGLSIQEVPDPVPPKGHVLIAVKAVGLNRADLLQSLGLYPAPPGAPRDIPGLEFMGVVEKSGGGIKKGERVMGLVPGGAFAEKLTASPKHLLRVPKTVSDTDAAAIAEAYTTAWDAVWVQAGIKRGQRLLIHAVGSGVGTAAVQLARALGVTSVGTSRTQAKLDQAKPDVAILAGDPPVFAEKSGPIDVCLDLVGGPYFGETVDAMAPRGTIMVVGVTGGPSAEVPLRSVLGKRLRVIGTTLRSRDDRERATITAKFARELLPLFKKGTLKAVVSSVRPMADAVQAFEQMAGNDTFGKTVLTW